MIDFTAWTPVQPDQEAYRAAVTGGAGSADGEFDDLMEALAALERQGLKPWTPLVESWGWPPPQIAGTAPFIVGLPGGGGLSARPVASEPDLGGNAGVLEQDVFYIDRFIAGGVESNNLLPALRLAAGLYLPLRRLIAANSSVFGLCSGARVTGATWQIQPLNTARYAGLAVHVEITTFYRLKVS